MLAPTRQEIRGGTRYCEFAFLPFGRQPKKTGAGYFQFTGVHFGQAIHVRRQEVQSIGDSGLMAGGEHGEDFAQSLADVFQF